MRAHACALTAVLWLSCSHTPKGGTLTELKAAAETFHQRVRWKDFIGAAELLVPEQRDAFTRARIRQNDERDLSITDFDLEDAQLSMDGKRAVVTSRIAWVKLPSATEQRDLVRSELVFRGQTWLIARQEGGPFSAELSRTPSTDAPTSAPETDRQP